MNASLRMSSEGFVHDDKFFLMCLRHLCRLVLLLLLLALRLQDIIKIRVHIPSPNHSSQAGSFRLWEKPALTHLQIGQAQQISLKLVASRSVYDVKSQPRGGMLVLSAYVPGMHSGKTQHRQNWNLVFGRRSRKHTQSPTQPQNAAPDGHDYQISIQRSCPSSGKPLSVCCGTSLAFRIGPETPTPK